MSGVLASRHRHRRAPLAADAGPRLGPARLLRRAARVADAYLGFSLTFGDSYPSPVDVLFVAVYLPMTVALLWIGHPPSPRQYWPAVLDTAVLSVAGTLIAWITLIEPTIHRLGLNHVGRALLILDWVGDIVIIAIGLLLLFTWRTNRSALVLCAALAGLLGADVWESIDLLNGYSRGTVVSTSRSCCSAACADWPRWIRRWRTSPRSAPRRRTWACGAWSRWPRLCSSRRARCSPKRRRGRCRRIPRSPSSAASSAC